MKMEFEYDDFRYKYLNSGILTPTKPLQPLNCIDAAKLSRDIDTLRVNERVRRTFDELEKRMGGEYFAEFERVQTRAKEYGSFVFPAYKILFLDVVCEDWLSLLDFHKGFSRDHSVHQPLTAYIVCKLLGGGNPNKAFQISGASILDKALDVIINGKESQYLRDRLAQIDPTSKLLRGDRNIWRAVFYQTAIVTAMYHDLGYPWQFIERMHGFLKDDLLLFGRLPDNSQSVKQYINAHRDELMFRPFYNYGRKGLTSADINDSLFDQYIHQSHGVTGALAYQAYNKEYRSNEKTATSSLLEFTQEWSSLAILMHDMQKAYKQENGGFPQLDFNTDPLSFIISLADTLEDFNRPNAEFKKKQKGCEIDYSFPSLSVELEENGGEAIIRYKMREETRLVQEGQKANDQKDLFDQPGGFFNLSSIGLTQLTIQCI